VDLRDDYDHRLLLLFYKELLQPHIAQDELESVEDWLKMLSPEGASKKDFHVLVALRYDSGKKNLASSTIDLIDEPLGDTPTILAGLTFKYLTSTNCGFLTYDLHSFHYNYYSHFFLPKLFDYEMARLKGGSRTCIGLACC